MPAITATVPRSQFVTVMAWISLGLAAMGVVGGVLQLLAWAMTRPDRQLLQMLHDIAPDLALPAALQWSLQHMGSLLVLSLLSSVVTAAVSWGLLQRREWGRIGFIALLVLGALVLLAGAWGFAAMIDWSNAQAGIDPELIDPLAARLQSTMVTLVYLGAVAIAVLHGALCWKLCTPAVRAEFIALR